MNINVLSATLKGHRGGLLEAPPAMAFVHKQTAACVQRTGAGFNLWTHSKHRRRGVGRKMMDILREALVGQHVYLFTDDQEAFYASCGFARRGAGLENVVGR